MALIEFKNKPSTDSPINANNLNHNFNYLKDQIPINIHENFSTDSLAVKCGYKIDGKDVYVKRIFFGDLPNSEIKEVDTGIDFSQYEIIKIEGYCKYKNNNVGFPIPFVNPTNLSLSIMVNITDNNCIQILTGNDRSNYVAWFSIYFI